MAAPVTIGIFGLFHPSELEIEPVRGRVLVIESNGRRQLLEGRGTLRLRSPATVTAQDPNAVELGMKFAADVNGSVTGVRFYKGPNNTGAHVGNLWSSSGQLLATVTFTNETASAAEAAPRKLRSQTSSRMERLRSPSIRSG